MAKVIEALVRLAQTYPMRVAFEDDQGSISYGGLAARVAGAFAELKNGQGPIGLMAENSIDWVVADLAITATGRRFIPLPPFFSDEQLAHIVSDGDLHEILSDDHNIARARAFAKVESVPRSLAPAERLLDAMPGNRVIYTSGSTGKPKGVQLGDGQIDFISQALAEAISATQADRYLSLLPFPLLLEELCGIHVPILVGGSSAIRRTVVAACAAGDLDAIRLAYEEVQPSVSVLVPELLRAWVGALLLGGHKAPESLRVIAVGGAPVPPQVLEAAKSVGIPCLEGYGLSECGSVVAVNRPGDAVAGSVGKPLPGIQVEIVDGEIVVDAPSVMDGYLGQPAQHGRWRTGDLGHFDGNGNLVVEGRKDAMLVTGFGRNVQPEWIEASFQGDARIARAVLAGHGQAFPTLILVPGPFAGDFFEAATPTDIFDMLDDICATAPVYARPASLILTSNGEMQSLGLLSPNGRIKRAIVHQWLQSTAARSRILRSPNEKDEVA